MDSPPPYSTESSQNNDPNMKKIQPPPPYYYNSENSQNQITGKWTIIERIDFERKSVFNIINKNVNSFTAVFAHSSTDCNRK